MTTQKNGVIVRSVINGGWNRKLTRAVARFYVLSRIVEWMIVTIYAPVVLARTKGAPTGELVDIGCHNAGSTPAWGATLLPIEVNE